MTTLSRVFFEKLDCGIRFADSAILNEIAGSLRQAAENANWDQANEVLKSRGDNAADTLN